MNFTKITTEKIREWLKENNFKVGCRLSEVMAFQPLDAFNNAHIMVPKNYDNSIDNFFIDFLKKCGYNDNFEGFTLGVLHEIGHFETNHLFNFEEWYFDYLIKTALFLENSYTEEQKKETLFKYWKTSTEFSANMWTIMYVQVFREKVVKLENLLKKYGE